MTNLKALRLVRGWSQEELAHRLGCDVTILSRIENNWFTRPPAGMESKLPEIFGSEWTFKRLMTSAREPKPDAA